MTTATIDAPETPLDRAALPDEAADLRQLQRQMLQKTLTAQSKQQLIDALTVLVVPHADPLAMFYFERTSAGELAEGTQLFPFDTDGQSDRFAKQLTASCQAACRHGEVYVRRQLAPTRVVIAAPVILRGSDPEAIGIIVAADDSPQHLVMIVQMIASHLVLWHVLADGRLAEAEAADAGALVELLDKVMSTTNSRDACYALAGELQRHLQCERVVVGLRRRGKGRCRLAAISGVSQFDKRSHAAQALESALDETVLRDDVTTWPPENDDQRHACLAHKALCWLEGSKSAISAPLRDGSGTAIGAVLLLTESTDTSNRSRRLLCAAERPLATALDVSQRLDGQPLTRGCRAFGRAARSRKGVIAALFVGLLLAAMAIPLPHKIRCDCQIEPVTRRFVAAPYEGTLESALVKPGYLVKQGEVVARMDGREIRLKRASVVADRSRAEKERDAAQAAHKYSEAQIARLEMERLDLELELLDHRAANLEIKSPVSGIVASGDLERAQGAPLTIGQTLFEVAPLDKIIVEVAVPEDAISLTHPGQNIAVRLDAYPDETWQAVVVKIHPRSEIRDEANVFIAEVELDNADGRLRPGMKGRAKIETTRRPLGWILFHKPWEYATKKLSW